MSNGNHSGLDFKILKEKYKKLTYSLKNKIIKKKEEILNSRKEKSSKEFDLNNIYIKLALSGLVLLLVLGLGLRQAKINKINSEAFNVYLGQTKIGVVRDEKDALIVLKDLKDELCKTYDMDIAINDEIEFEETYAKDKLLTSNSELKNNIKSKIDYQVYGYTLEVDGEVIGSLKTQEEIENILERIREPYEEAIEEDKLLKEIKFVEDIRIVKEQMQIGDLSTGEKIYETLLTSSEEVRTHVVEVGESFWTIALFYNMEIEDLIEANPDKNPDVLQIGDEVRLVIPKPVVTVASIYEVAYTDELNYETEIELDDNMYNIHTKTKVSGEKGLVRVVAEEIKYNGYHRDKIIIKEEILEEPTNEILVRGTKEPPKTMATGTFLMPTRGRISSRYGMRNGSMHRGLDIASSSGTDIKAADGGKVVYTGYKGAYGNLVEIDHENGYKTRYAHNSKILVKVGERVYKGQTIAKMGSTGRSTGSHLHFEVLVNGANKNPSNYVN